MDSTNSKVEIQNRVRELLSRERYEHTLGVCDTAESLAGQYGCDVGKVAKTALLHDIARDFSQDEMQRVIRQDEPDAVFSETFQHEPLLLHARAGAAVARNQFGIDDREILRGIELHTTGGPGMGLLERIIFVADFIEPGRTMSSVKRARQLARENLETAMLYILKLVLNYLLDGERCILTDSIDAYNEIILNRKN
jgi:predicted HD superfamily hydrolase involved in NAD metabolism